MTLILVNMGLQMVCLVMIPVAVWGMVCARRAGEERIKILECLRHRPMSWGIVLAAMEEVSFQQHMRAVMLFRDAWALYDPVVLDAIRNPRTEVIGGIAMGEPPPTVN